MDAVPSEAYGGRVEPLEVPPLEAVASALAAALREDYREAAVDVVPCPDLSAPSLGALCQRGLGGRSVVTDHGGEPFNHDPDYNETVRFDMRKVGAALGMPGAAVLGAGACAAEVIGGHWGELAVAADLADGGGNASVSARVDAATGGCVAAPYPSLLHGGICNLLLTEGQPGPVLRVRAKGRVGVERSLPQSLRRGLAGFEGATALGGTFRVLRGKVKAHVQPDRCRCPEGYYDAARMCCVKDFLQFYEGEAAFGPDLVMLSVLWSRDPTGGAMHLRSSGEHTHFFSLRPGAEGSEAGHYHGDDPAVPLPPGAVLYSMFPHFIDQWLASAQPYVPVQGGEIEYEGYFVLAERLARVRDGVAEATARRERKAVQQYSHV
jgi:hypothetical protein